MVIVSSVIGNGPLLDEPVAAAELFPAAVLAPPTPPLTTPADSMGTAMMPNVACPDAAIPRETALLAWVLAALAFCALSAAFAIVRLARIVEKTKSLVKECNLIDISLVGTEYFG